MAFFKQKRDRQLTPDEVFGGRQKQSGKAVFCVLTARSTGRSVAGSALLGRAFIMTAAGLTVLMGGGYAATFLFTSGGFFTVRAGNPVNGSKRISLSETMGFSNPTVQLKANGIDEMDNITYDWLPLDEIDTLDGAHNGDNYVAYSFYIRNSGTEALDYRADLIWTKATRGIENAARVMVYYNGDPTVYAAPSESGSSENFPVGLTDFYGENTVSSEVKSLDVDAYDRYTVVIWLEGEDPECIDDVRSGVMRMEMNFVVLDDDKSPLNESNEAVANDE